MKMVCFCEKAHFRFIYTTHSPSTPPLFYTCYSINLRTFYYLCHHIH